MDPATRKAQLRGWALATRAGLDPAQRVLRSEAAARHVAQAPIGAPERRLAVYAPIRDEADPSPLYARPHLAFPRVGEGRIQLHWCARDVLVPRPPFGIPEPPFDAPVVHPPDLDVVLVPGLVFDARGGRIGFGKGYYDRLLAALRAAHPAVRAVGFCFEAQVVDAVPEEPFDQRLDALATEAGLRWFGVERLDKRG